MAKDTLAAACSYGNLRQRWEFGRGTGQPGGVLRPVRAGRDCWHDLRLRRQPHYRHGREPAWRR